MDLDALMTEENDSPPPPLIVRWFHAIDNPIIDPIAIRKAKRSKSSQTLSSAGTKKAPSKNWVPFSVRDTNLLEKTYQQKSDLIVSVPVNEDYLFQVDVAKRHISPIYWEGPVYAVRRATWFIQQDSSTFVPCEEALANQIERGYLNLKPYSRKEAQPNSNSNANETVRGSKESEELKKLQQQQQQQTESSAVDGEEQQQQVLQEDLSGIYQGQYVIYKTATEARLYYADIKSNAAIAFFTKFTSSSKSGVRIVRGYDQVLKETKKPNSGVKRMGSLTSTAAAPSAKKEDTATTSQHMRETSEKKYHLGTDKKLSAEEVDKERMEHLKEDYDNEESEEEVRNIDQLVFVIHGIGQQMSERVTGQNFVHDVNILRKTLKSAWFTTHLATETKVAVNGIQVIPILWRKSILFGEAEEDSKDPNTESDIGEVQHQQDDGCPTLEEITLEGAPNIRTLVSDVFLDVPLYLIEKYHDLMIQIVTKEINRVYKLFIEKNPQFTKNNGQVHILAHSLGSLLAFDILCAQPFTSQPTTKGGRRPSTTDLHDGLDFPVKNFFALGSPLGMMLLLRSNKIISRQQLEQSPPRTTNKKLGFFKSSTTSPSSHDYHKNNNKNSHHNNISFVYPAIDNMYNIFHKSDPVAYRLEPLVARHYGSKLKPVPIPYLKGGLKSMLDASFNVAANKAGAMIDSFKSTGMFVRSLGGYFSSSTSSSTITSSTPLNDISDRGGKQDGNLFNSSTESLSTQTSEDDAHKLKLLNSTGRIDYCLQEGLLENAYISALSVHMSYWQDMDVAGFLIRELYMSK
ncbi:DDHD domain-containing protein [Mycotypha africana]|uniref:DDHD domain-containing protein n=1 Tax=Mycotypha africana TaxID=64632 RepID=UPI0023018FC0|nr:DDHD domain-containing protein [Mycotypha africana]KAI8968333.1 DDHD domain-containing protein [Mycotypha africana]